MKIRQVGVHLYTVREHCRTAAELAETARKLRAIGYQSVQHTWSCPVPHGEVARIIAGEGLTISSSHENAQAILDRPAEVVDNLHRLGCRLVAYPYPHGIAFADAAVVREFVRQLDAAGAVFRAAGMTLGYHNHDLEFAAFEGGTVLDYLFAQTDPHHIVGEPDTYWVQVGGGDSVALCRNLRGRMPFIHLKDHRLMPDGKATWTEIGRGTLPFARIIAEAERSGCEHFIVEQDTCPGDPFDSLRQSFEYIRDRLAER